MSATPTGDPVELAREALQRGTEAAALPIVSAAARRTADDARLWQWTGLLLRALDRRMEAQAAFDRAARLAPGDASIAHGRAHIALEAGGDAVPLFEAARRLAPGEATIPLGLAAARLAAGDARTAVTEIDALLADRPLWIAGHQQLAQIRWMMGDRAGFAASYDRALAHAPRDEGLWGAYLIQLIQAKAHDAAFAAIARARQLLPASPMLDANEAVLRAETGDEGRADALFDQLAPITDPTLALHHVRHLLKTGRVAAALPEIERWTKLPAGRAMWPYAAIAWRIAGDPRYRWLDGQPGLISVIDLADRLPPFDRLAEKLRALHHARGQHLDQSVRGGTQTDGILFANVDPLIQATRAAVTDAVAAHIAQLPPPDAGHPTLAPRRDRDVRFAGSWSVRLSGQGHHANHVHPAGWLSSALYIALPEVNGEPRNAGWLTLGEPQAELALGLPPEREIEPKPGRLVLFPSTMWHGTVPFAQGERLTIAFDVAHPAP